MREQEIRAMISVVREVVRRELARQLPEMVQRTLAEQYVQRVVSEAQPPRPRSRLAELMMGDPNEEEIIPEPKENPDHGIYPEDPLSDEKKEQTNEGIRRLLAKNPAMAHIFEGTAPIPADGASGAPVVPDKLVEGLDVDKMRQMAGLVAPPRPAAENVDTTAMKRIEANRRRLDERVVGPARPPASTLRSTANRPPALLDATTDFSFPDRPIELQPD